jgi:hypothetical protein
MKNTFSLLVVAGLSLVILVGCDNGRAAVTGKVTYQGQPVENGSINFEPIDGKGGTAGGSIQNGTFQLNGDAGVFPGKKRVNILVVLKTGKQVPAGRPYPEGTMVDEVKPIQLPPQEAEILSGQANELDFSL